MQRDTGEIKTTEYTMYAIYLFIFFLLTFHLLLNCLLTQRNESTTRKNLSDLLEQYSLPKSGNKAALLDHLRAFSEDRAKWTA